MNTKRPYHKSSITPKSQKTVNASTKEHRQKRILLGLILTVCLLGLVGAVALMLTPESPPKGGSQATQQAEPVSEKNISPEQIAAQENKSAEEKGQTEGLGENWEERLTFARSVVEGMKKTVTDNPSLNDDNEVRGLRSKAMAKIREAEEEASNGDPVLARSALGLVVDSGEKFNSYLAARTKVLPALERFETAKKGATEKGVHRFEEDLFRQAVASRQKAEKATSNGDAELAIQAYDEGVVHLQQADAHFDATVADLRKEVHQTFDSGDVEGATAAINKILARISNDPEAEQFRPRIAVLNKTYPLYQKALKNEETELYAIAEGQYRKILYLDEEFADTAVRLEQIEKLRASKLAEKRLAEARNALQHSDIEKALHLAQSTVNLTPENSEAEDLLRIIQAQFEEQTLAKSLTEAKDHAVAGDLEAAERVYLDLVNDFPGSREVSQGLAQVRSGMRQKYQSKAYTEKAREALDCGSVACLEEGINYAQEALMLQPDFQDANNLVAALQERLQLLNTPVEVVLVSDGQTRLEVYRVGIFEAVRRQPIRLKPGSYTVVGKRRGYRDVYMDISATPGAGQTTHHIVCNEQL